MAHQDLLDLARVDVVTAAHQHVLLAVDDGEDALGVLRAEVARAEPAVHHHRGRVLRPAQVALEQVVPADHDLPDDARRQELDRVLDRGVRDRDVDAPQRASHRARARRLGHVVERHRRRGLGEPVALVHRGAERRLELLEHRHRQGGPPGDRVPQRRPPGVLGRGRQQRHVHRGHRGEHRGPVPHHQVERLHRVEPGDQQHGGAASERGVHHRALPEAVEQREPAEHDVVGGHVERVDERHVHLLDEREVRAHGALGAPGGAAGVEHRRRRQRVDGLEPADRLGDRGLVLEAGDAALRRERLRQEHGHDRHAGGGRGGRRHREQRRRDHEDPRAAVAQHVLDLLRLEQQVDGDHDRAEREDRVVHAREVGDVRHQHRHPVARADAAGPQRARVAAGLRPQVPVGRRRARPDHRRPVGGATGLLGEDRCHRQAAVAEPGQRGVRRGLGVRGRGVEGWRGIKW